MLKVIKWKKLHWKLIKYSFFRLITKLHNFTTDQCIHANFTPKWYMYSMTDIQVHYFFYKWFLNYVLSRVTIQMEEWNSLTFPRFFQVYLKKIPTEQHIIFWWQSMQNEIKNTIKTNNKANMLNSFCCKLFIVLELNV